MVQRFGKSCHEKARASVDLPRLSEEKLSAAKEQCLTNEQCRGLLVWPCTLNWSEQSGHEDYKICYIGYSYHDSLTECIYEKTGNLFSFSELYLHLEKIKFIQFNKLHYRHQIFSAKLDLAADIPPGGCPFGSYGFGTHDCEYEGADTKCDAPNTCFCEEHCSWKRCKIDKPPQSCLQHAKREWVYNPERKYWRTNLKGKLPPNRIDGNSLKIDINIA